MDLKEIFGIGLPTKDVDNALQLLEFCKGFGKVWFFTLTIFPNVLFDELQFIVALNSLLSK